ncbi:GtrA family protein [Paenibacillus glucanolyticus]|uniref:GtrA family protein n=2 Tax=Paenibacillus TaxID=44249 RepID=UPI001D13D0EF
MYLIIGVLTTIINIATYYMLHLYIDYLISNALAWIVSVLFAYVSNRLYVFKSNASVTREFTFFIISRLLSGVLDMALMFVFIDFFNSDNFTSKVIINLVVIMFNYIFSKLIVFNMRRNDKK